MKSWVRQLREIRTNFFLVIFIYRSSLKRRIQNCTVHLSVSVLVGAWLLETNNHCWFVPTIVSQGTKGRSLKAENTCFDVDDYTPSSFLHTIRLTIMLENRVSLHCYSNFTRATFLCTLTHNFWLQRKSWYSRRP